MRKIKFQEKLAEEERRRLVKIAKRTLWDSKGEEALNYLRNVRKLSDNVIDEFNLGFCPRNANHQLAGRIITPLVDQYGELVALTTRHLDKDAYHRFWHESFEKGYYLYGLHIAKSSILSYGKAVIVEGEFDVLQLHSKNISIAVGICGSSFSIYQAAILSRYCSDIYIVFDGDAAGKNATSRAMKMYRKYNLKSYGIQYFPVYLDDCDPDDFIMKHGSKEFIKMLKQSKKGTF